MPSAIYIFEYIEMMFLHSTLQMDSLPYGYQHICLHPGILKAASLSSIAYIKVYFCKF